MQFMQALGGAGFNLEHLKALTATLPASTGVPETPPITHATSPTIHVAPTAPTIVSATAKSASATSQTGKVATAASAPTLAVNPPFLDTPSGSPKDEVETPVQVCYYLCLMYCMTLNLSMI